ncbi:hypothetical protein HO173_011666 [Letharia columbiana]|uniref:Methyltransferase domain-containing protein n=1 Tax=Letharia columbiana TaxID=112416 RepID=A0A8H6CSN6_9LECA|nr:uncharacterized protein HO173_011666 [Letharia columbiana]KAF6228818.1 hypothetical protein HO173_011666 [Letharia columbiana]
MNSKEKSDHDASGVAKFLTTDPAEVDKKINEPIKKLLQEYSHIPQETTVGHVLELRDRAFAIFPYACIGQLRFLNLSLRTHPAYPQILHRLTSTPNTTLLDLGCCFAQDLRQLVLDGVASDRLYGIDVDRKFIDLGYDLFLDRSTLDSHFLTVDALGPSAAQDLAGVNAKIDIVWAASFFHLFPRPRQLAVAKTVVALLKPVPGSMLLGRQLGSVKPGEYDVMKDGRWQFRHDVQSWTEFWEEMGRETDTRWRVEASLDEVDFGYAQNREWGDPDMRRLLFQVVRE